MNQNTIFIDPLGAREFLVNMPTPIVEKSNPLDPMPKMSVDLSSADSGFRTPIIVDSQSPATEYGFSWVLDTLAKVDGLDASQLNTGLGDSGLRIVIQPQVDDTEAVLLEVVRFLDTWVQLTSGSDNVVFRFSDTTAHVFVSKFRKVLEKLEQWRWRARTDERLADIKADMKDLKKQFVNAHGKAYKLRQKLNDLDGRSPDRERELHNALRTHKRACVTPYNEDRTLASAARVLKARKAIAKAKQTTEKLQPIIAQYMDEAGRAMSVGDRLAAERESLEDQTSPEVHIETRVVGDMIDLVTHVG